MAETAKVTLYRIRRCGYYKGHDETPKFGAITDMLRSLKQWSTGRLIAERATYQTREDRELLPAYVVNVEEHRGSFLVTLWNEIPHTDSGVASIAADSRNGSPEVFINDIRPGSIPGYACYFWIVPDSGFFASVKFNHLLGGVAQFNEYMQAYAAHFSPWCVHGTDDEANAEGVDIFIKGYAEHEGGEPESLAPRFRSSLVTKPSERQSLIDNADRIRKLLRRTEMRIGGAAKADMWQRMLRNVGLSSGPRPLPNAKLSFKMDVTLDAEQVRKIIEEFDAPNQLSDWEDVGFQLAGDPKPKWLNRMIARNDYDLEILRENAELVNPQSLAAELFRVQPDLVTLLTR